MPVRPLGRVGERLLLTALAGLAIAVASGDAPGARQDSYDFQALRGEIDTGFRPGRDDWQFPNDGSTLVYRPEGHALGMLLTAAWYYAAKPDGPDAHLFSRYGEGADRTAIWEDDRKALRLVSTVDNDLDREGAVVTPPVLAAKQAPRDVWRAVASAMAERREPQILRMLQVSDDNTRIVAVKHLLVYRISDARLYVADPVYPGRDRMPVELTPDGRFQPYVSKSLASDDEAVQFNTAMLYRAGPITRKQIPERWRQFLDGHAGDKEFSPYVLQALDGDGSSRPIADGDWLPASRVTLHARNGDLAYGLRVFRDGSWTSEDTNKGVTIDLRPGPNTIGLKVSLPALGKWAWHDFAYLTLNSAACDVKIAPARQYCIVAQHCPLPFAVSTALPRDSFAIDWYVDSALRTSNGPGEIDFVAPREEGPHWIRAALRNRATGRVTCEAEALANVQARPPDKPQEKTEAPKPEEPPARAVAPAGGDHREFFAALRECDRIWIELDYSGVYNVVYGDGEQDTSRRDNWRLGGQLRVVAGTSPPSWDGTSFSWSYTTEGGDKGEIRGTISPDSTWLVSLVATETHTIDAPAGTKGTHTWRVEAKNIHFANWNAQARDYPGTIQAWYETARNVSAVIVKAEDVEDEWLANDPRWNRHGPVRRRTSLAVPAWADGSGITIYFVRPSK